MLVFPQLSTGASALYPLTKTSRQRTVVNTLGDGSIDLYADPDARSLGWEIQAKGLTAVEWNAIEALFQATSGMWQTFTFLDPTGNLLARERDFQCVGVDERSADQLDGGSCRSFRDDAGDAGYQCGARDGGRRADAGGAGQFSLLP